MSTILLRDREQQWLRMVTFLKIKGLQTEICTLVLTTVIFKALQSTDYFVKSMQTNGDPQYSTGEGRSLSPSLLIPHMAQRGAGERLARRESQFLSPSTKPGKPTNGPGASHHCSWALILAHPSVCNITSEEQKKKTIPKVWGAICSFF